MKTNYSVPKAVSRYLRRVQFTARGAHLAPTAREYCLFVFSCWYALFRDHLPQTSLRHFCNSTDRVDVAEFGLLLKQYSTNLRLYANSFTEDGRISVTEFEVRAGLPSGYGWLTCLRPLLEEFLYLPTAGTLKVLLQLVDFPTRANVSGVITEEALLAEYCSLEDDYPEQELDILNDIDGLIPDILEEDVIPAHGPGAVAELTRSMAEKEFLLACEDYRLRYALRRISFPTTESAINLDRCSRLIFVPKSLWTYRTISAEPAVLQFWQHGVSLAIERMFDRCWISEHIRLRDQAHSQRLCRRGSWFGEYDTIDLSEASDRVSWDAVKRLTRSCPCLRRWLAATRSDETLLPDGRRIKLKKFAPMGSACAFPIESLFFCCICEIAVMKVAGRRSSPSDYCVYGDDIVIRSEFTSTLIDLLTRLGSKVNTKKSFFSSRLMNFREACGVEYFNGEDVTPLRFPRFIQIDWKGWERNAGPILGLLDFRNAAYCRKFFYLSAFLDSFLEVRVPYNLIRRVPRLEWQGGLVLVTEDVWATNYQLETRYNHALQRVEYKCLRVSSRPTCKLDSYLGLQSWLTRAARQEKICMPEHIASQIGYTTGWWYEPLCGGSDPEVTFLSIGWEG